MQREHSRWEIDDESATVAVVDAVSTATNTPHEELEPLHEQVDTDALNALVARSEDVSVSFEYAGFAVEVTTSVVVPREPGDSR